MTAALSPARAPVAPSLLASPLRLRSAALPNRIAKAALSERLATPTGDPGEALGNLYGRWAGGGAGMLLTGNVMVDRVHVAERGNVVVDGSTNGAALAAWSRTMRSGGASAWMQINHPGRQAPRMADAAPVAPSAVPMRIGWGAFARPRALREDEIAGIVEAFGVAAARAKEAGFDGVQIHGAHGYLVNQFLSPLTNLRDDAWGGDARRRRRFLEAVIRRVRAAVGDFPVALKLNSADFQRGGFDEAESLDVVRMAVAEGIDLLEVSGGTYESPAMFAAGGEDAPRAASTRAREAYFLHYAEAVRAIVPVPLLVTGGFRTVAGMEEALRSGAVDVIGLGRPFCVDPAFPAALLDGRAVEVPRPVLATGVRDLDGMIEGGWYLAQLQRMGTGAPPDPDLTRARAVWTYFASGGRSR